MNRLQFWVTGMRYEGTYVPGELQIRLRRWWARHWPYARIRQLDQERRYWQDQTKRHEVVLARAQSVVGQVEYDRMVGSAPVTGTGTVSLLPNEWQAIREALNL